MSRITFHRSASLVALLAFAVPIPAGYSQLGRGGGPALVASLICYALAAVTVSLPRWRLRRLPLPPTVLSIVFFLVSVEQAYRAVPVRPVAGQAPWFTAGFLLMVFALGARLRFRWATILWAGVCLLSLQRWTVVDGTLVITETYPVAGLATLLATWLGYQEAVRFSRRRSETLRMLRTARSSDEAEQDTQIASYQRVQEVRRLAGGLLERIAHDPSEITSYDTHQFWLAEAQLRDTIRGRSIATPYILEVTRTAREHGVAVDILDERGQVLPPPVMEATTEQVTTVLQQARRGTVTIRAFPPGDPTAVCIVHDGYDESDDPVAIEIADGTGEVSRF